MTRQKMEFIKKQYPKGTRIQLGYMEGEDDMPSGLKGTVRIVDDIGQIHVAWDNGRTLAINPECDRFSAIEEQELIEMKLYAPIIVRGADPYRFTEDDMPIVNSHLTDEDLQIINKFMSGYRLDNTDNRGLMHGFYGSTPVDKKVVSAYPSVERYEGKLWGVTTLKLTDYLKKEELDELYEYITRENANGYGALLENQQIKTSVGDVYVSLWHSGSDYALHREDEPPVQKIKPDCPLIGADGNIFNLLGIALRTLKHNGMSADAKEMVQRVTSSGSYDEALCIIGEYVNITGSDDQDDDFAYTDNDSMYME